MANPRWEGDDGSFPTTFTTTGNWDTGSAPADGDNVYFRNNSVNVLLGLTNSAIEPAALYIDMSYTGVIGGTSATVNSLGANYLELGPVLTEIGNGDGTGSARLKLNYTSDVNTTIVYNTASDGIDDFLPPVRLIGTNASNKYYQYGGSVGWAVEDPDETSTLSEFTISGGTLLLGAGVTWTTAYQTEGTVTLSSGGTTYTQQGGTLYVNGSDATRTMTIGGTCYLNARTATMSVSGITRSSTTATATVSSTATLATGDYVRVMGADQAGYNGYKQITVASGTTFTFTVDDGDETPATGTMTCRQAIGSMTLYGTLDISADSRNVDIASLVFGPNATVIVNKANPSHLHFGSLAFSGGANRLTATN